MRIGIDFGGTKIEGIALGAEGVELARLRCSTPREDYQRTIAAIVAMVKRIEENCNAAGTIGVAIPGTVSPATGLVKNANSTWINGRAFDVDLGKALARPVRFANDANCFALSEAIDGAAAGKEVVFGVIIGTGCGGGIVINGRPLVGPHAIAGEWGHNPLPWPSATEHANAPSCFCGRSGCLETWISGPGFAAAHKRNAGQDLSAAEIVAAAHAGDAAAKASVALLADRIARGLATVINVLDPDCIVLGGGLSNADALYELIPERLPDYVFSDQTSVPILKHVHGDSGGVRGAAWLWPEATGTAGAGA